MGVRRHPKASLRHEACRCAPQECQKKKPRCKSQARGPFRFLRVLRLTTRACTLAPHRAPRPADGARRWFLRARAAAPPPRLVVALLQARGGAPTVVLVGALKLVLVGATTVVLVVALQQVLLYTTKDDLELSNQHLLVLTKKKKK